jgi:BlaI family penicillinase repressor
MKETTKISDAEWRVCQVLWRNSPLATSEVIARLADSTSWNPNTIKTLLTRLVKKGVLDFKSLGRENHYFPKLSEEECVDTHTRSFVDRVFNGGVAAMAAAFIKRHRLTDEEIAEFKMILEEASRKNNAGSQTQSENPPVES